VTSVASAASSTVVLTPEAFTLSTIPVPKAVAPIAPTSRARPRTKPDRSVEARKRVASITEKATKESRWRESLVLANFGAFCDEGNRGWTSQNLRNFFSVVHSLFQCPGDLVDGEVWAQHEAETRAACGVPEGGLWMRNHVEKLVSTRGESTFNIRSPQLEELLKIRYRVLHSDTREANYRRKGVHVIDAPAIEAPNAMQTEAVVAESVQ